MRKNVGKTDIVIRVILSAAFIALALYLNIWLILIVPAILLATAIFRFCPLYAIFGIKTSRPCCGKSGTEEHKEEGGCGCGCHGKNG